MDRRVSAFYPVTAVTRHQLAEAMLLASLGDQTPDARISGNDYGGREFRKGTLDAIRTWIVGKGGRIDLEVLARVADIARRGSTPLVVAEGKHVLGILELK
jgi:potassium-transporting ATPase ATP-binding subunit